MKKFFLLMLMAIAMTSCQTTNLSSINKQTGSYISITIWGDQLTAEEIDQLENEMFSIENQNISTKKVRKNTEKWAQTNMNKKIYLFMYRSVKTSLGSMSSKSYSAIPFIWITLIITGIIILLLEILGTTEIILTIVVTIRKWLSKN